MAAVMKKMQFELEGNGISNICTFLAEIDLIPFRISVSLYFKSFAFLIFFSLAFFIL